jgi:hypothetical protein
MHLAPNQEYSAPTVTLHEGMQMATKPTLRPMQIRIPDSSRNWLKAQARAEDRSMNYVLVKLLEQAQQQQRHPQESAR